MAKIKLNLSRLSDAELRDLALNHHNVIKDDAAYADADPAHAAFNTTLTGFTGKLADAVNKSAQAVAATTAKDGARVTLEAALTKRATYAEDKTGGDAAALQALLFDLRDAPGAPQPMPQVTSLSLTMGDDEGEQDGVCDPVPRVRNYEVQTSPDGITWTTAMMAPKSKFTLTGQTPGAMNHVRVRAHGALGPGPWSDVASKRVP